MFSEDQGIRMFDSDGISDGVSCEIYALDAHSIVHEQGLAWRALLPEPFGQGDTLGSAAASNLIFSKTIGD